MAIPGRADQAAGEATEGRLRMALEDRRSCEHCGHPLNPKPYLMAQRFEQPLLPWPWALVVLAGLLVTCLLIARAM